MINVSLKGTRTKFIKLKPTFKSEERSLPKVFIIENKIHNLSEEDKTNQNDVSLGPYHRNNNFM